MPAWMKLSDCWRQAGQRTGLTARDRRRVVGAAGRARRFGGKGGGTRGKSPPNAPAGDPDRQRRPSRNKPGRRPSPVGHASAYPLGRLGPASKSCKQAAEPVTSIRRVVGSDFPRNQAGERRLGADAREPRGGSEKRDLYALRSHKSLARAKTPKSSARGRKRRPR
jgi:hypothetical protein